MNSTLNDAIKAFEAVEANLVKLEKIWQEIAQLIPSVNTVSSVGDPNRYRDMVRSFDHIAQQMPTIDGFALSCVIMDPDAILSTLIDLAELSDIQASLSMDAELNRQGDILQEYRFRLNVKRKSLARQTIDKHCKEIDGILISLKLVSQKLGRGKSMPKEKWSQLRTAAEAMDTLLGNSLKRPDRWNDFFRHLHFGLKQDFFDIIEHDWPSIKNTLEKTLYDETDPIPIAVKDLGDLVASKPSGVIATKLQWAHLSDEDFERLLFNLIDKALGYENPQWLTHVHAPDGGRDLSVYRVQKDPLGESRRTRIIIACKKVKSIGLKTIAELKEQMKLWEAPRVEELIIATSGRFSSDAVDWIEKHNQSDTALRIQMWPNSHLERLLAERPELIAEFQLRN